MVAEGLAIILWGTVFAQSSSLPAFEVATVKLSPPSTDGRIHTRRSIDSARLLFTNVTLRDLVKDAFGVQDQQVSGPDWMTIDRFDIAGTIPTGVSKDRFPQMLQSLLAERFGLVLHKESRVLTLYSMTAAKNGTTLQKVESASGLTSDSGRACNRVSGATTMAQLTDFLSQRLNRPVIDNTRLDGPYRIAMNWAPDAAVPDVEPCGPSLVTAAREQLGLNLNAQKGPVTVIVIDQMNRAPTEN
jgi:uncharacterized protein (TIGR03435 family)